MLKRSSQPLTTLAQPTIRTAVHPMFAAKYLQTVTSRLEHFIQVAHLVQQSGTAFEHPQPESIIRALPDHS